MKIEHNGFNIEGTRRECIDFFYRELFLVEHIISEETYKELTSELGAVTYLAVNTMPLVEKEKIRELRKEGLSLRQIAKQVGYSHERVRQVLMES